VRRPETCMHAYASSRVSDHWLSITIVLASSNFNFRILDLGILGILDILDILLIIEFFRIIFWTFRVYQRIPENSTVLLYSVTQNLLPITEFNSGSSG
jgi:hypothetical protein